MAQAISEIILEWTKSTFQTLDSIPKDAETRNNLFRKFAESNKEIDAKKHLGIFYTQLEKHIEKNLGGKYLDFIKKRQAPPKQEVTGLKTNITLNPKQDEVKTSSVGSGAGQQQSKPAGDASSAGQTVTPPPFSEDVAALPVKAVVMIMKLRCPVVPDLSEDEVKAVGQTLYPLLAPYVGQNWFKWVMAGTMLTAILGGRLKIYNEYMKEHKDDKKQEKPKEEPKPEPKEEKQQPALFDSTPKPEPKSEKPSPARERDKLIADLKARGYSEEKIKALLD